jgi:hypothetical protein
VKARVAKKLLQAALRGQVQVIGPGRALVLRFDPRRYPAERLKLIAQSWQEAARMPVLLCPQDIEITVATHEESWRAQ